MLLVNRFLKGLFNSRTALPRYLGTWDATQVLKKLAEINPAIQLTLQMLTLKLVLLLAWVTSQRCQTLHLLEIYQLHFQGKEVCITIAGLLKQSRPGFHVKPIVL